MEEPGPEEAASSLAGRAPGPRGPAARAMLAGASWQRPSAPSSPSQSLPVTRCGRRMLRACLGTPTPSAGVGGGFGGRELGVLRWGLGHESPAWLQSLWSHLFTSGVSTMSFYLFTLGCAGSCCCMRAFSRCGAWASHCAGAQALGVQAYLSSCSTQAPRLRLSGSRARAQ